MLFVMLRQALCELSKSWGTRTLVFTSEALYYMNPLNPYVTIKNWQIILGINAFTWEFTYHYRILFGTRDSDIPEA